MPTSVEREIKLRMPDAAEARRALAALGARTLRARRLQRDQLLDTVDESLRARQCALRVRIEPDASYITFKGPLQPSPMKLREEVETAVGGGAAMLAILERLGFRVWFRYEKYREEFTINGIVAAVDETPVGVFVELEGSAEGIAETAAALGRGPADYLLTSYRGLFVEDCTVRGVPPGDMLFEEREA